MATPPNKKRLPSSNLIINGTSIEFADFGWGKLVSCGFSRSSKPVVLPSGKVIEFMELAPTREGGWTCYVGFRYSRDRCFYLPKIDDITELPKVAYVKLLFLER